MRIKCLGDGCSWSLYATKIVDDEEPFFRVQKMANEHHCVGVLHRGHSQASATFVGAQIQAKLRDQPSYRLKDIQKDIHRDLGIQISYIQAYRAKEEGLKAINGTDEESYEKMLKYCEDLKRNNPGSIIVLECTPEEDGRRFQRVFICYGATASGFQYCRPVLGLDGTHLNSKYKGILLTATATDANESLFPLAYAVVSSENNDNWLWFNRLLRNVITEHAPLFLDPQALTFVSDRQKGLLEALATVFPQSPSGYCLRHLYENMWKEFKHPELKTFLWEAARAITEEDFRKALSGIEGISKKALEWLLNHASPEHWAELYFPGRRYGHITSNIAESLNSAILEAREKPILQMFEHIRVKMMEWYEKRRKIDAPGAIPENQIIVSHVAKTIQDLMVWQARRYRILAANDTVYEIFSLENTKNFVVKLDYMMCTCFQWQSTGIPCSHAISVILAHREDPQMYVQAFLSIDAYRNTYINAIFPPNADVADRPLQYTLQNISTDDESDEERSRDRVIAPHTNCQPGRPRKQRIRTGVEGLFGTKRSKRCRRCKSLGHSQNTCTSAISGS